MQARHPHIKGEGIKHVPSLKSSQQCREKEKRSPNEPENSDVTPPRQSDISGKGCAHLASQMRSFVGKHLSADTSSISYRSNTN